MCRIRRIRSITRRSRLRSRNNISRRTSGNRIRIRDCRRVVIRNIGSMCSRVIITSRIINHNIRGRIVIRIRMSSIRTMSIVINISCNRRVGRIHIRDNRVCGGGVCGGCGSRIISISRVSMNIIIMCICWALSSSVRSRCRISRCRCRRRISTRSLRSGRIIRRRRLSSTRGRIIHMRTILSGGCSCYITHCYHILSTSMIL